METMLEKKIDAMEDRLSGIEDMQERIYTLLSGNPINKNDSGIVGRVDKLEERVSKIEKWNTKIWYIAVGISFGAGWGFSDILKAIIFKN